MTTIPMTIPEVLFLIGIGFLGGGVSASIYWHYRLSILRLSWTHLEHKLARAENREPREIYEVIP